MFCSKPFIKTVDTFFIPYLTKTISNMKHESEEVFIPASKIKGKLDTKK